MTYGSSMKLNKLVTLKILMFFKFNIIYNKFYKS